MADQTITCPNCGCEISLTETLVGQIEESVRKKLGAEARARDEALRKREAELQEARKSVEDERQTLEQTLARKLTLEKAKLREEAATKAREDLRLEFKDLEENLREKEARLEEARRAELDLRKKARELEEKERMMKLEQERALDAEREKIRQQALEIFSEEHRLKDAEKDKLMADMRRTIEDLKRKSEQGSMQTQGEVGELDLEEMLIRRFPSDSIEPVPKGIRGADIVQKVYTRSGHLSGTIVWEAKRTKAWNEEWITKLKDDQREIKAEVAVLVTEAMPKDLTTFSMVDGVWVSDFRSAEGLAEALRAGLIEVAKARGAAVGKGEKMEAVYNYLSGAEFRQKVEGIVEAFRTLKEDLDKEKRAIFRMWSKREQQIERVIMNTARMYGDMQGIIGATLPEIKALELESGEASEEVEE